MSYVKVPAAPRTPLLPLRERNKEGTVHPADGLRQPESSTGGEGSTPTARSVAGSLPSYSFPSGEGVGGLWAGDGRGLPHPRSDLTHHARDTAEGEEDPLRLAALGTSP